MPSPQILATILDLYDRLPVSLGLAEELVGLHNKFGFGFALLLPMRLSSFIFSLSVLTLPNFVFPSKGWTAPTADCKIEATSLFQKNTNLLRELNNLSLDFADLVLKRKSEGNLDASEFLSWKSSLEVKTEAYLSAAGFTFKKINTDKVLFKKILSELGTDVEFPKYQILTGSQNEDFTALNLKSVLESKRLAGLKVYLDPFLFLYRPKTLGFFTPQNFELSLTLSSVAQNAIGIGNTLGHEAHHAIENLKLRSGEFTLSRFIGKNEGANDGEYSALFSLDELETHLRDFRYLKEIAAANDKYQICELQEKAVSLRKEAVQKNLQMLQDLLTKAKFVLGQIEKINSDQKKPSYAWVEKPYRFMYYEADVGGMFTGIIFRSLPNESDIYSNLLAKQLKLAQNRIQEIGIEVQKLSGLPL